MDTFSYGVGNRAASFRIPTSVAAANGKGYIEDRRPASNIDAYLVCAMIVDTSVLPASKSQPLKDAYKTWADWRKTQNMENIV